MELTEHQRNVLCGLRASMGLMVGQIRHSTQGVRSDSARAMNAIATNIEQALLAAEGILARAEQQPDGDAQWF